MGRVLDSIRRWSDMPVAIQLGHAGRKASTEVPWKGGAQLSPDDPKGWQTVAPSALPFMAHENAPQSLDREGLARVRDAFAEAAVRAARLGIDAIQVHGAHGYLLHQFLSPLSNRRDDEYGGSLENRMRFVLEVFDAVRNAFPADRPVTMRLNDWVEGGWDIGQTIELAQALEACGCAAINMSSGGLDARQQIAAGGYQAARAPSSRQPACPWSRSVDHRVRAGRNDCCHGRCRHVGMARTTLQPRAMARRRASGRQRQRTGPISALGAATISGAV